MSELAIMIHPSARNGLCREPTGDGGEGVGAVGNWRVREERPAKWYAELPESDQGQLRECYLTAIEAVGPGLREKYAKIYRNH